MNTCNLSLEAVVAQTLRIPQHQVCEDLTYQSISEWDSLAHVDLMVALEKAYQVNIGNELVLQLNSVGSIKRFIEDNQRSKAVGRAITEQVVEQATAAVPKQKARTIAKGLKRVFFDRTTITKIDPLARDLVFRGYSVHDLAQHATFEEAAYLLLHGELPAASQLSDFDRELRELRSIPEGVLGIIRAVASLHPMHVLRTAVSALPAFQVSRGGGKSACSRDGLRLIAQVPTIAAAHHRIRCGLEVIQPNPELSHAANFLYMLTGEIPESGDVWHFERDIVLHVDHSSTPSTFAARLTAGTQADIYAAITAAIATLGGDLHGKAPENIITMFNEIGSAENAAAYVRSKREQNEPVMGFGHRIYRTEDPRARHSRQSVAQLSARQGGKDFIAIADALVEAMKPYAKHGININDDFYSSIMLHLLGIREDLFGCIAVMSRSVGLVAHVIEQYENNIMMAPSLEYVGRAARVYIPLEQRE